MFVIDEVYILFNFNIEIVLMHTGHFEPGGL
jgi:hypothetical protein